MKLFDCEFSLELWPIDGSDSCPRKSETDKEAR